LFEVEMLLETTERAGGDLLRTLERRITERTLGRVRCLTVQQNGNRITVSGSTPSYFIKQMAIQAALEVLDPARTPLELDMRVTVPARD
jgi:hypothetical protein